MINLNGITSRYTAKPLTENELTEALALCKSNTEYYSFYTGSVTAENIRSDMNAVPPNVSLQNKIYAGFYDTGVLTAIIDLILKYPNDETAFIGLFMTHAFIQSRGIGTEIITGLSLYLKGLGYSFLRLACIKQNYRGLAFWIKNGFAATGDEHLVDGNIVCIMQKSL